MTYSEILKFLYGNDISSILKVLNRSIYVTDFKDKGEESLIVHTGFSFCNQSGKKFELYYDLRSGSIIRQMRNDVTSIPRICGIQVSKNGNAYLNQAFDLVVYGINNNDDSQGCLGYIKDIDLVSTTEDITELILTDKQTDNEWTINSVYVFQGDEVIYEYPLQKHLSEIIYFGNGRFERYVSFQKDEDDYYNDNYDSRQAFRDATDGQLDNYDGADFDFLGRGG